MNGRAFKPLRRQVGQDDRPLQTYRLGTQMVSHGVFAGTDERVHGRSSLSLCSMEGGTRRLSLLARL